MNRRGFINLGLCAGIAAIAPAAMLALPTFESELERDTLVLARAEHMRDAHVAAGGTIDGVSLAELDRVIDSHHAPLYLVVSRRTADYWGVAYE